MDPSISNMRALVKENSTEGYELKEIPVPTIEADEILFKVERVAICGSDIALYLWNEVAKVIGTIPFIPGHEAAGTVVKVGSDVVDVSVGERVSIENHFFCGYCYSCENGRGDICAKMNQYGHGKGTTQGGFSEYSVVKSKYCYVLKTDISFDDAVLLEPMGVAFNGVNRINPLGKEVLIIGAGAIGLLAAACAKALGASKVLVADINSERLQLAKTMGADVIINSRETNLQSEVMRLTNGDGVPRLVEASGNAQVVNSCFKLLQKGAELVFIGLHRQPFHVDDFLNDIVFKSLTLHTVHGRRIFDTWMKTEQLVSEGKVDPKKIISHSMTMSQWQEAFDTLLSGRACKIVIDPQQ